MRKIALTMVLLIASLMAFASGAAEDDGSVITIWHSNSGRIGAAFETLVDRFNDTIGKDNGIRIEAIYQGTANDVLTKVKAAAAQDQSSLPDIAQMDATAALDMKNADYLVTAEETGADISSILPSAIEALNSDRGLLAVPFNCSSLLLYYNKTVFEEAGVEPPRTLDEFASIAEAISQKDDNGKIVRYAFAGVPTTYELGAFIGAQKGLSYMVDARNGHFGIPSKVLFEEEGTFRNFLEHWKAFYDTGYVANLTSGISDEFAAGRTATMLASSSNLSTVIATVAGRFEVGTAFVPAVDEEATGGVNIGGGALFSFSDSEGVRLVLEFLTSPESQLYWAENTGYMAINTLLYDTDEYKRFLDDNPQFAVAMEQTLSSNPEVVGIWLPSAYQIYYSFQSEIREVTENGKDIDKAVSDMAGIIGRAIDEYRTQNGL